MSSTQQASKTMNVILWILQFLLAATFVWAGTMKLFHPAGLPWAWIKENPHLVKLTGLVDLLAGIGLMVPALLRIQPQLTIYAAYGTLVLMIAASVFHIARGESSQIGINIFMALAAALIAWGRQKSTRNIW